MVCAAATLDGLLLAAAARPVASDGGSPSMAESGLAANVAAVVGARRRELQESSPARRRESLRLAAARLTPEITAEGLPARARALLAADVPRSLGERWLAESPAPRRGFRAGKGLRTTLARMGRRRAREAEPDVDARGRGRRALLHARSVLASDEACLGKLSVEPEEAVAVQTLEGLAADVVAGPPAPLLRLLLRATGARPDGVDISLALGRMLSGAALDEAGEANLERAGRELSEWTRATCPE